MLVRTQSRRVGAGPAFGARRRLGGHRTRRAGRDRGARPDRRPRRRRAGLHQPAIAGVARRRRFAAGHGGADRSHRAARCRDDCDGRDADRGGRAARAVGRRRHAARRGAARRALGERRTGGPAHPPGARRRAGRDGTDSADRLGPDDPDVLRAAPGRARLPTTRGRADLPTHDSTHGFAGRRRGRRQSRAVAEYAAVDSGAAVGSRRCRVGRLRIGQRRPAARRRRALRSPSSRMSMALLPPTASPGSGKSRTSRRAYSRHCRRGSSPGVASGGTTSSTRRPVLLVSESLARRELGSPGAALGRRLSAFPTDPGAEIVGVIEDVHHDGLDQPAPNTVVYPPRARADGVVRRAQRAGRSGGLPARSAPGHLVGQRRTLDGAPADDGRDVSARRWDARR